MGRDRQNWCNGYHMKPTNPPDAGVPREMGDMPEELKTKLLELVQGITLRKVDVDEPLLESGLVDSISAVDLALQMEAEFGVSMPAERIHEYMRTVRTLADHVLASHR